MKSSSRFPEIIIWFMQQYLVDMLKIHMEMMDQDIQEKELKVEDNQEQNLIQSLNQSRLKEKETIKMMKILYKTCKGTLAMD